MIYLDEILNPTNVQQFDSIICISQTPWQGQFQNSAVQLMTELSKRYRIIYVDYQYTVKDWVMGVTGRRTVPVWELLNLSSPLSKKKLENGGEIYIWIPPIMLPTNWLSNESHDKVLQWNVNQLARGLRHVMKQLGVQHPLVVNAFNPVWGLPLLGKLNECATIYYCYDEITAESWISRHGQRYEQEYLKKVDAVITTSEALRQTKSRTQPNTFCVKNGANFSLFSQARKLAKLQPPTQPVVGYLGTADNRINIDLVEHCARTMPDVTFQFIGEVNEPALKERLSGFTNVLFTPSVPPAELPQLLAKWTAAIIPFVCNAHTYTIYPLKINEYLAAGLPVVSTPFSILDDFNEVIELANSPEDFAQALRKALADTSPQRIEQRIEMAKSNSWPKRAEEFEGVIRQIPQAWMEEQTL
ncbi:glycosyltransferase [Tellurirhabdus bombi]|uniref:glycosyltransferase n=1 Tax=Tellurirhabdus bombi TaxID=2907205 RepID=UPI00286E3F84|nr:glycosyltransferase [Tellurirhabdus bombi]